MYAYTAFTVYSTEGVLGCGGCGSTAAKWRRVLLRIERRYRDQCRGASGSRYAGRVRRAGGGWRRVCAADAVPRRVSGVQFMWTNAKRNMRCNVLFPRPRATSTSRGRLTAALTGSTRRRARRHEWHHTGLGRTGPSSRFFHGRPCQQPLSLAVNAVPDLPRDVDRGDGPDAAVGA